MKEALGYTINQPGHFIKAYFFRDWLSRVRLTSLAIATIWVLGKMHLSQAISCNSYLPRRFYAS
jgi:hypothetical protein